MTLDQLERLCVAIYGGEWQSALARDLDKNDRTIRRWVQGKSVPDGIEDELRRIVAARIAAHQQRIKHLKRLGASL